MMESCFNNFLEAFDKNDFCYENEDNFFHIEKIFVTEHVVYSLFRLIFTTLDVCLSMQIKKWTGFSIDSENQEINLLNVSAY
jgi:hypothetical protein